VSHGESSATRSVAIYLIAACAGITWAGSLKRYPISFLQAEEMFGPLIGTHQASQRLRRL
jgi:hypothetical protein